MSNQSKIVLVLDDDENVRKSFVDFFDDRGWKTLSAVTAEEALEVLTREQVDGVIVDIRLPGMNGDEFIQTSRLIFPSLAYVICTGSPEYEPPKDITVLSQVFGSVFDKPCTNLNALEEALRLQIEKCNRQGK